MCYNCDCGDPKDPMGNNNNITDQITFEGLSKKWGLSFEDVRQIVYNELIGTQPQSDQKTDIDKMYKDASKVWGQSVEEARANTLKLLKRELNI